MICADYEKIVPQGELGFRLSKNLARLQEAEYRPEVVFSIEKNGWAGDWEGRTILALTLLSRATGQKAAFLDAILERLEDELNAKGYLKGILPAGGADEQQLSGHNWLLRGLIEHYLWTGRSRSAMLARQLVENLFLPALPLYAVYPTEPAERSRSGGADGRLDGTMVNGWRLSTDIGCAFMSFDGLSQYYAVFGDERVAELINAMYAAFSRIDFVKASMQTHASLSACRGIMRYYQCTRRPELLTFLGRFFRFYQEYGMTENYANYNWFDRPLWTEPCGFIDSFILAEELWKETRDTAYLQTANRIFQSAIGHGQRFNGGFGCDDCVGPGGTEKLLRAQRKHYEAYWCCTMRGAEGLSRAAQNAVLLEDDCFYLTGAYAGEYDFGAAKVCVDAQTGKDYMLRVRVTGSEGRKQFRMYVPQGVCTLVVSVNGIPVPAVWENGLLAAELIGSGEIIVRAQLVIRTASPESKVTPEGLCTCWLGDMMLGVNTEHPVTPDLEKLTMENGVWTDGEHVLEPVGRSIYLEKENLLARSMQVLFEKR